MPQGCKAAYENAEVWRNFGSIVDDITSVVTGDVTGDGDVDINDVNALINIMLGNQQ